LTESWIEAV